MFARGEGRLGHAQVRARGGADVDGINRLVGEEVVEILIRLDLRHVEYDRFAGVEVADRGGEVALEPLGVEIADRGDGHAVDLAVGADVHRGHEAKPDDADVDVVAGHMVKVG